MAVAEQLIIDASAATGARLGQLCGELIRLVQQAQELAPQHPDVTRNARRQYALAISALEEAGLRCQRAGECIADG